MITLEPVLDSASPASVELQASILNSHPAFNLMVLHKELITPEEITKENKQNVLEMGEKLLFIKENRQSIGIIAYLPSNPGDKHCWIGLFIVHRGFARLGIGSIALHAFERRLKQENVTKTRLAVQLENLIGASFWHKSGYTNIKSTKDQHGNRVNVYEKELVR
ncbi:GNAT family N-acetyltransferase [Paenibacillus sp. S150]|uniref:GNAT family N-acetyltransferase n=1 Tax=Paenibacillus sp. S150 TaxID=2749826 RepID=UPI001C584B78|nr:GNAT family N-acetyltransferase [Paenibacillus sp. S150]MBW4084478.1 GNAT family N-acetyltransferase [Paenibacillus sp. S150]